MRLDEAYSTDLKRKITASQADELYEQDKIHSKFSFQCPGYNCDAPVTCANLDRPKNERKRNPYYKVVGKHGSECDIAKDIEPQKKRSRITSDIYSDSDEFIARPIRLNLQPPSTKRPEPIDQNGGESDAETRAKPGNTSESGKHKIQKTQTLSSLIDDFLKKKTMPDRVEFPNGSVIDSGILFVEINGQELSELENEFRIYYGKAWFNKKKEGYSIVFDNKLTSAGIPMWTSTFLRRDMLDKSGFKRYKVNEIEELANKIPKTVFILSQYRPKMRNGYITISCKGLEYLCYRLRTKTN